MYNILICDDERDIVSALKIYLTNDGYNAVCAYSGTEAVEKVRSGDIHLVLMDVMMPGLDGIGAMAAIREECNVPVILLTAKSEDTDKVLGLNMGADDYITKPFNPVELLARVRSQLRRYMKLGGSAERPEQLTIGRITVDDRTKMAYADGENVSLTPTEYEILRFLMQNPGQVFSPDEIYRRVWHETPYGSGSTVAVHVRHIREKIEIDPAEPAYLKMVWGRGYKFEAGEKR